MSTVTGEDEVEYRVWSSLVSCEIFQKQLLTFGVEVALILFRGNARNVGLAHARVVIPFTVAEDDVFDSHG
jgi:hypothetical protein